VSWRLSGLWRGEAFYRGLPTSYWRRQILDYPDGMAEYSRDLPLTMMRYHVDPPESPVDKLLQLCHLPDRREPIPFPFEERSPAAVPVLIELLRDSHPVVRRYAADCLGDLGPQARPAVPALQQALQDREVGGLFVCTVSDAAADALDRIDPGTAPHAATPGPAGEGSGGDEGR
jgi:hypothetical protein